MKITASKKSPASENVAAAEEVVDGQIVFTQSGLLEVLSSIEELRGYDLELTDSPNGPMLKIGDSVYHLNTSTATEVAVPEEVAEDIQAVEDTSLADLTDGEDAPFDRADEPVEAGIIKSIVKTLLVGGMVRLLPKLLK